jgi:hypothetical protein
VPDEHLYDVTMYILAGMLVGGFVCNLLVRPLADKWFMKPEEVAALQAGRGNAASMPSGGSGIGKGGLDLPAALFWLFVGIPLAWGVYKTVMSALKLF